MRWIVSLDNGLARVSYLCGWIATVALILLLLNVFYDVVARYAFNDVSIGMQELEWHLYSIVFMLGVPYAMRTDGHVRVDVFYDRWGDRAKAWVNLVGSAVFAIPFALLIVWYGSGFTAESFELGETSGDPGGLAYRWLIKGLVPVAAVFMATSGLGMITKAIRVLVLGESYTSSKSGGGLA
jgi:TRAP-type mannitol/chloroaromatic compound transport system permease small subunit